MRLLLAAALLLAVPHQDESVPAFTLEDAGGKRHTLREGRAAVLVFIGVECPMSNRYLARLAELQKTCDAKHIDFFAINPNAHESREAIAAHAKDNALPFPVLIDADQRIADAPKVETIPCAFLLDGSRRVRYRGRIDDHKSADLVKRRFLRDALDGKDVASTAPVGCEIQRRLPEARDSPVTYANRVAKILNDNCVACHRPGQVAPFPLTTYQNARRWSKNIVRATHAGAMPPWKPANDGLFRDERRLAKEDLAALTTWADAGSPLGDAAAVPAIPAFRDGWTLGEPDLVLEPEAEYDVEAAGSDEYRCFVLDPKLDEDRFVTAVEFRPGNPRVVHHVMTYIDGKGESIKFDLRDDGLGYSSRGTGPGFMPLGDMGGWGPGMQPVPLPDGMGYLLPRGCRIVLEVHYHKDGRAAKDRTKLALRFARGPVAQRVRSHVVINMSFRIPADEKRFPVRASWNVNESVHAIGIIPHMHLLGREIEVIAELPDGTRRSMVHVKEWDFNWQEQYRYREPFALPKGTRVQLTGWFDNSTDNPNQPRTAPKAVGFGEATTDEMCVAYIAFVKDTER